MNPTYAALGEDRSVTRWQRIRAPSTKHHDWGFARTWHVYRVSLDLRSNSTINFVNRSKIKVLTFYYFPILNTKNLDNYILN